MNMLFFELILLLFIIIFFSCSLGAPFRKRPTKQLKPLKIEQAMPEKIEDNQQACKEINECNWNVASGCADNEEKFPVVKNSNNDNDEIYLLCIKRKNKT